MKVQSQDEINESNLLEIIEKINHLLNKFEQYYKQNWQVVMLVGSTGNGKSTIFNYLSGFEFMLKEEGIKNVFVLKNPQQQGASLMKGGSSSVTKEPHYFFNHDNQHILIDFPGFCDTEGFMSQQIIQILFNRIVIKTSIKIILVVKQTDDDLNQRGNEFNNFISNCFAQQNNKFHLVTIILNSYMGSSEDVDLISNLKSELKEIKDNKNIVVTRKIKTPHDLNSYFNKDKKEEIWNIIEKSDPINFQTAQMKNNFQIAKFINNQCLQITKEIVDEICLYIKTNLQNLKIESIERLQIHYKSIRRLTNINIQYQNIYDWYYDFIDICSDITKIFNCDVAVKKNIDNFLKIFAFFAQDESIIDTQKLLKENRDYIINELISKEDTVKYTLEIKQQELGLVFPLRVVKGIGLKISSQFCSLI